MRQMNWMRGAAGLLAAVLLQACGDTAVAQPEGAERTARAPEALETQAESVDILSRLASIPGLTVVAEQPSPFPGTRFFRLTFEQPADHRRPEGERFQLSATLLHRSVDAPVVLYSGGYTLNTRPSQYEPTALLQANQLSVEHRFFGASRPASGDWTLLDIEQAAGDYHRLIQAFKPLYSGRWLTTGGSKGGMAAVYHRYFYPDDVDATVAYVAPNVRGLNDVRFIKFLERVGDADCRERLLHFQRDALGRREELLPYMEALASGYGTGYGVLGVERALEFSIVELPFYFWQYGGADWCQYVPAPGAPADEVFFFINAIDDVLGTYSDLGLDFFAAYYYQAATEIGWNRYPTQALRDLLRYPREDVPSVYLPFTVEERFDQDLMLRVEHWVRNEGQRMMFLYGDRDPWSAGPYDVREGNDAWRFTVPDANHTNARITRLPELERALALERLSEWMGVPQGAKASALAAELEAGGGQDVAPLVDRRPRL